MSPRSGACKCASRVSPIGTGIAERCSSEHSGSSLAHLANHVTRFLAVGGTNTVLTYVIMLVLTTLASRATAYTVAFAVGVAFNAVVTGPVVFATRPTIARIAGYAAWFVVVYFVGLGAVSAATALRVRPLPLALAVPFLFTIPMSFAGARFFFANKTDSSGGDPTS